MTKKKFQKISCIVVSLVLIFSYFVGVMSNNVGAADTANIDAIIKAANDYVDANGNNVTVQGLTDAVKAVNSDVALSESDFYIKHSVNGAKDNTTDYPLDIKGSNGAVVALFALDGKKYGFSRTFGYKTEIINITKTAVVGTSSGFTYDASGNVTKYTGDADKIVFPATYTGTMSKLSDLTYAQNVKVVIINNTKKTLLVKQAFYDWDGLIAVQISGDKSHYFFTQKGSGVSDNEKVFANCDNLKYVSLPNETKAASWATGYLPYRCFEGSKKLENVNMPVLVHADSTTANHKVQIGTFQGTAVRDLVFPQYVNSYDDAFSGPTYSAGTRNIHLYADKMTFVRAAANIAAALKDSDISLDESGTKQSAKNAVCGTSDAATFAESLSFTYKSTDYDYGQNRVLTVKKDDVEIPIEIIASKTLTDLSVDKYSISPDFNASCTEYSVNVPSNTEKVDVIAENVNGATVMAITGNTDLKVGANDVIITVKTAETKTVTYKITVNRAEPLDANYAMLANVVNTYVLNKKNATTPAELLEYLQTQVPAAEFDTENDFYIKHAVNGAEDDVSKYHLEIAGSDGAVSVIITYNGKRYGITSAFPHSVETIEVTGIAIVGTSKGFTYDADKNVIGYSGTADKIVFPEGYTGTMKPLADLSSVSQVKVVIYNSGVPMLTDAFKGWEGLVAVKIDNGSNNMQLAAVTDKSNNNDKQESMFSDCPNLKYFEFPSSVSSNGHYWYDMFPSKYLQNCPKLETVIMPKTATSGNYTNYGYRTFYKTAVRDIVWPEYSRDVVDKNEATAASTIPNGTRNIHTTKENMTFVRAMALAAAGVNELGVTATFENAETAATNAITGTLDASSLAEKLIYSVDGEWKNTDNTVGGTIVVTDETEISVLYFTASKTLKGIDIGTPLTPTFSPDVLNYTAEVITDKVDVNAIVAEGAEVTGITGNTDLVINVPKDVKITVKNTDGNTVVYTITVTRKPLSVLDEALINRVKAYAEAYVAHNSTTQEDYAGYLAGYDKDLAVSVKITDYYKYDAIQGANNGNTVLVAGHNGYISARVLISNTKDTVEAVLSTTVLPNIKNYTFASNEIAKASDFHLSEDGKTLEWFDGDAKLIVVPNGVQEIDLAWFSGEHPENVVALILPESCVNLPSNLCYGMKNLEVCYLGNGIETLPTGTFMRCYKLQYVHLPEHLTTIGTQAFKFAQTLPALYIPESVTTIGTEAFWICGVRDYTLSVNLETINSYGICYPQGNAGIYSEPNVFTPEYKQELQAIMDGYQLNKHNVTVTVLSDKLALAAMSSIHCSNTGHKLGSVLEIRAKASAKENIFEKVGLSANSVYDWNLDMTFCECLSRAKFASDHLLIEKDDKADSVSQSILDAFYSTKDTVAAWIKEFKISNGRATGTLRITQGDDTADIVIDRPLYVATAASRDLGLKKNDLKASYKGDNDTSVTDQYEADLMDEQYASYKITSEKYGFDAEYKDGKGFPEGYYIDALKISSKRLSKTALKVLGNMPFAAYDVAMLDSEDYIQEPQGVMQVTMDVPKDFTAKSAKVYMLVDDEFYDMKSEVVDGKLSFETDKFGIFVVTNNRVKVVANTESSYVGLIVGISVGAAVLVAAIVLCVIMILKKRKR